jgi:5-methylcytosine-specific restriction endonuclease McrA
MDSTEYIKLKYNDLIPRSFKTKLDVYLFYRCYKKRVIGTFEKWEFNRFRIDDTILGLYNRAWQLKGEERFSEKDLTMYEIDIEIEKWKSENRTYIEDLFKEYKILFITDYFPFSKFEALFSINPNERICTYCKITDKDIELLDNKGMIFTKRSRGFAMEIDRIEPNLEYTSDNCVLACYWCNNAKTDEFSSDEFSEHIGPGIQSVWKKRNS